MRRTGPAMSGTNPSTDPLAPHEPYRWGAKPESLEAKFKMLVLLSFNRGTKRKHSLVLAFLLDWYHSKYGNALASVRHILDHLQARDPEGKGLFAGDVHSALTDLIAWGFLEQEKGSGRRASRYVPKWDILDSVRDSLNARGGVQGVQRSVRETPNESVRETPNATDVCVRDFLNEDPSTVTRLKDVVTVVEVDDCAAASPPPAHAPSGGGAAGSAQEGFVELWNAYGYRHKIREARTAYKKLEPGPELHARLVEAARAWQQGWAAQKKRDAPRFTLARWLEREEYECEPPRSRHPLKTSQFDNGREAA